jgi:hypothetical protein
MLNAWSGEGLRDRRTPRRYHAANRNSEAAAFAAGGMFRFVQVKIGSRAIRRPVDNKPSGHHMGVVLEVLSKEQKQERPPDKALPEFFHSGPSTKEFVVI